MSAQLDIPLYEVAPISSSNPKSTLFMQGDLERSGLTTKDIECYPIEPEGFSQVAAYCIRYPDKRIWTKRLNVPKGQAKYIANKGLNGIWYPPQLTLNSLMQANTIYMIEGEKKAAKFYKQFGLPTIGIKGCWGFSTSKLTTDGTSMLLPDVQSILTPHKKLVVVFDADIENNVGIQRAAARLISLNHARLIDIQICKPPEGKGADDWLVAEPKAKVSDLVNIDASSFQRTWKELYKQLNVPMKIDKDGIAVGPLLIESSALKIYTYLLNGRLSTDIYNGYMYDNRSIENQDILNAELLVELQDEIHGAWKATVARTAINLILARNQTNTVLDYLRTIKWDGVKRLNTWASDIITADNSKIYIQEWGRIMMIGLTLRIVEQGMQLDRCFVLSGKQGIGKTTFFRQLSEIQNHQYYTVIADSHTDNGALVKLNKALKSALVADMDEGILMDRTEATHIKSLISNTVGENRKFGGEHSEKYPRGNIFVSTANKGEILKDKTGARRFLILKATKLEYLTYDTKIQIMAEVLANEEAIRKTEWWKLDAKCKGDNLTAHEEAMSVEDYLNRDHQELDIIADWLARLLEVEKEYACVKKTGVSFINIPFIHRKAEQSSLSQSSRNFIARRISELTDSQTFPFELTKYLPRASQLDFRNDNIKAIYMDNIENPDGQLTGYLVRPR